MGLANMLCWMGHKVTEHISQDFPVHINFNRMPVNAAALPPIHEPCLIYWSKYSLLPRLSDCQIRLWNELCWFCHNETHNICWGFSAVPELQSYASKCCSFATNWRANVSYPDSATQYCLDWLCCQKGLANLQCSSCHNETHDIGPGCCDVPDSDSFMHVSIFELRNAYTASGFRCTSHVHLTIDWIKFDALLITFGSCHLSRNMPTGNLWCSLSIDFIWCWPLIIMKKANAITL